MVASSSDSLADVLASHTADGVLYQSLEKNAVRCFACGHRCLVPDGQRGICRVRFNENGHLRVPWGYVGALQCDPIEKKPFFHVMPGVDVLSFGMLGCDFHCGYCQNWVTSQALRDSAAVSPPLACSPERLVELAIERGAKFIASTYNEPLITAEWSAAVFEIAKSKGLRCGFVSNGNATSEVLDYLEPYLDAYKVDLKSFQDKQYRKLGGVLDSVLRSIQDIHDRGIWLEIVTLVVPGFNDSEGELRQIAEFVASVSDEIPWHVTAFHQEYKMTAPDNTSSDQLVRAAEIGQQSGLKFVYAGNRPGRVARWEDTNCPSCKKCLIRREGFLVVKNDLVRDACASCGYRLPGIWN